MGDMGEVPPEATEETTDCGKKRVNPALQQPLIPRNIKENTYQKTHCEDNKWRKGNFEGIKTWKVESEGQAQLSTQDGRC
jgi:hypothetical protein